jgi:purine-nucleoside phosphorylase
MSVSQDIETSVAAIRAKTRVAPRIGVILGSGLGAICDPLDRATSLPFSEIPHFPISTVEGHAGRLVVGVRQDVPIAFMAGRVHYYEGHDIAQVIYPTRVLARLGVSILIVTNAAGSVNVNYRPGELMILADHINFMGVNPLHGAHDASFGPRFTDMSAAYDPKLREVAERACAKVGATVRQGVYMAFAGPSYETPAEVKMARTLGADAVGMSTVPEVVAARQMGLRVLGLSCLTNMAAGISKQALSHAEVLATAARARAALKDALDHIIVGAARLL